MRATHHIRRFVFSALLFFSATAPSLGQPMSLVIGIDGLGYGERGLTRADTPHIDSLISGEWADGYHGSYSDQAFAGGLRGGKTQQPTVSGPGWSTLLTGVWADRHGVTDNSFNGRNYRSNPTFLELVEEALPEVVSGSFVTWDPIDSYIVSSVDDGDSQMDARLDLNNDGSTAISAARYLEDLPIGVPASVFVALDDVDVAGHQCGSSGNATRMQFVSRMSSSDECSGWSRGRTSFDQEEWQVVLTSDHGHRPVGGHGGQTTLERQIPFIVSNRRVRQGFLTPEGNGVDVSHADVSPTVLEHFGIPLPEHLWGESRANGPAIMPLEGDFDGDSVLDVTDIDLLTAHVAEGTHDTDYDLNADRLVDFHDIEFGFTVWPNRG